MDIYLAVKQIPAKANTMADLLSRWYILFYHILDYLWHRCSREMAVVDYFVQLVIFLRLYLKCLNQSYMRSGTQLAYHAYSTVAHFIPLISTIIPTVIHHAHISLHSPKAGLPSPRLFSLGLSQLAYTFHAFRSLGHLRLYLGVPNHYIQAHCTWVSQAV